MGFRYKGEHKGSTMKARGKNTLWAFFNAFLVVALVVGLMPGVSFAGDAARIALQVNDKPAEKTAVETASDSGSGKGDSGKKADSEKSDSDKSDSGKSDAAKGDSASSSGSSSSADETAKAPKEDSATDEKDDPSSTTKDDSADKSDAKDDTDSDKSSDKAKESDDKSVAQDDEDDPADKQTPATKPVDEGSSTSTAKSEEPEGATASAPTDASASTDSNTSGSITADESTLEDDDDRAVSNDEDANSPAATAKDADTDDDDESDDSKKSTTLADKIKNEAKRSKAASINVAAADTSETTNFTVELDSALTPNATKDGVSYYAPTDKEGDDYVLKFKVSFKDADYDSSGSSATKAYITNSLNSAEPTVKTVDVNKSGDIWSGTFDVKESEARVSTTVSVVETDKNGASASKEFASKIVIDKTVPSDVAVEWEMVTADNVKGSGADLNYILGQNVDSISAFATITVKDDNLRFPENAFNGDGSESTKIVASSTDDKLDATVDTEWKLQTAATPDSQAVYACKIKFATKNSESLTDGTNFAPKLEIMPVDYSGNKPSDATSDIGTMAIVKVDTDAPKIEVTGVDSNSITGAIPTYLKEGTVTVKVTEPNAVEENLKGKIGTDNLEFSALSDGERTAKVVFAESEGNDANTVYITTEGEYTLTVNDKDLVGNQATPYSATFIYDRTKPTIEVKYTDSVSGDSTSTETLKDPERDKDATTGEAWIAANETVTVALADDNNKELDNDSTKTYVKCTKSYNSTESDVSCAITDGKCEVTLDAADDGAKYTIEITATDKAGNKAEYTAIFTVHSAAPTLNIEWDDEDNQPTAMDGFNPFYKSRTATVTIVDSLFDNTKATLAVEGGVVDGTAWGSGTEPNSYVTKVKYVENAKDANLAVSYKSKAGKNSVAPAASSIAISDGAYVSDKFNILAKPIMNVVKPQVAPTKNADDGDRWYYVLGENGEAEFTVTVIDLDFSTNKNSVKLQATCEPEEAQTISDWSDNGIFHTQTITYNRDCDVTGFKIETPGYVGSADNPWADDVRLSANTPLDSSGTYTHDPLDFAIDNTPPIVANLTFDKTPVSTREVDNQKVRYFGESVNANLEVTEKHLASNGSNITVGLTKNGAEQAVPSPLRGSDPLRMLWNDIPLSMATSDELTYVLSVGGTDLAGKNLILVQDESLKDVLYGSKTFASTAVVDTRGPRLKVTYDKPVEGSAAFFNGSVTATIEVTDLSLDDARPLDDGSGIKIQDLVNGVANKTATLERDANDPTKYTAKITIDNVNDAMHTLQIEGKDLADNKMIAAEGSGLAVDDGVYTQDIQVEKVSPELTVTMDPYTTSTTPHTVIAESGKVPTYYYNTKVKLDGAVSDNANITKETIDATITPGLSSVKTPAVDGKTATDIFSAGGFEIGSATGTTQDGEYTIQVTGTDTAGNQMKAAEGATNRARDDGAMNNGVYQAKIVYDTTLPTVAVSYKQESDASYTALAYNTTKVSGKKLLFQAVFSEPIHAEDATFQVKVGNLTKQVTNLQWDSKADADKPRATFEIDVEANEDERFELSIDACDWAGNKLAGNSSASSVATPYIATIDVDKLRPTISVAYSPAYKAIRDAKTADEKRYYNSDSVTATITVVENHFVPGNITVTAPNATVGTWKSDGYKRTIEVTFARELAYSLTVVGADEVGNLLASGDDATFITTTDTESKYACQLIVDRTAPTVKVTYSESPTPGASDVELANGGKKQNANDLYAFVTITEALSFTHAAEDGSTFAITTTGAIQRPDDKIWKDNGDGTYTATILYQTGADTDKAFDLKVTGADLASNKLVDYAAVIDIDKYCPRLSVSFDRTPGDTTDLNTADETRYYNATNLPVTVNVRIVEPNNPLDLSRITFTNAFSGATGTLTFTEEQDGTTYVYMASLTLDVPAADVVHTLNIYGADAVGNLLASVNMSDESPDGNDPMVAAGVYTSKVSLDVTQPHLSVEWDNAHAKNGKYFKEDRAATVKITETNFRPDRVSVKQNDTELNGGTWTEAAKGSRWTSGSGSNQKTWTRTGDNVWTFSVKPSYTDPTLATKNNSQSVDASKDFDQHLAVTAVDRALNDLSSTVDDNATPASDQAPTCAGGVYTSAGFVIDEYAPEAYVLISREKKWTSDDGKIDYFNGSLVATLYIKDIHYGVGHEESTAPVVNFGAGKERSGWSASNHEGQLWWYRMAFGQNEQGADPHMIDATICDYAGNKVVYRYGQSGQKSGTYYGDEQDNAKRLTGTSGFYVDTTAPDVKPFSGREDIPTHHYSGKYGSNKGAILFTKDATSMNIRVTDNIGLFKIDLVEKSDGKDEPANYSYSTDDEKSGFKHGDKSHNITIKLKEETTHGAGEFNGHLVLRCEDAAKNKCYWSINTATGSMVDVTPLYGNEGTLYPEKFIQDTVAPVLTFSGSVPASGAENARYYNSEQSVTLDVDEASFYWLKRYDASQEIMNIAKRSGDASLSSSQESVSVGDFNKVTEDKYTYTKQFATDGHYTIDAHLTDPAGNVAQEKRIEEFTIDRTDPTIQVTWDNNDARNGNYYKAGRTATLVVTEHNFDASRITITTSGSIGGWSSNGDTHTCTVACTSDGRYALQVSGTDKAGNQLAPYNEPEFVVDMIAPTISFSQVEDQTAYNDNIAPVIVYEDEANFNSGAMEYTLTGAKYGTQSMAASQGSSGNSGTVTYADFDREVESDDIWTLDAHVTDMAGNEADNHIMFSVNRFGSNFMIEDADDYAEGYLDEAREVRVREVNVSGVSSENHGVTVTHGLTTENLERQSSSGGSSATGYYIDEGSESTGWSAYTYHIGAGNFPDDGNYHVVVNSTDVATNLNNSANYYDPASHENADAEVSFILDTVAPIIDSLSILPGGTYDAGQKNVTFNVIDNIGCDDVAVTLDGERLPASDVALDASGLCMVNVPAVAFKARDMEIVATDRAGHTAEESVLGFHMTTNPLELHMPVVAGGAIVVAAAAVGGVLFVRRRRL